MADSVDYTGHEQQQYRLSAKEKSDKSYVTAVCLSSVFGVIGVQHFYLGRTLEGCIDLFLTLGWIYCFATGEVLYGILFVAMDVIHAFVTTIMLLTGSFKDGQGKYVCYPGQKLK